MFTFKNVGKELCFWARFFLTVLTIIWMLSVILGAVALHFLLKEVGVGDVFPAGTIILPVLGGIVTFLLGYLMIRFSTIKLYAQGKTVAYLASIDSKLDQLCAGNAAPAFEPPVFAPTAPKPVEKPAPVPVEPIPAAQPVQKGFCVKCGSQNPEGSVFCTNCGASLN